MADSRAKVPSRVEDFRRRLDAIENELRLLPQNLCVLLTHTPLTQKGSQYSLFEGKGVHGLGTHWHSAGELPYYPLVDLSPEQFPFGKDRFPFGVVLSRTSSLLELTVDAENRTWLNFGGKCGFYVADNTVRDSPPARPSTHELTERTIWHYFAENPVAPIPEESSFGSVYEQLLHCYRGIRETLMEIEGQLSLGGDELTGIIYELDWPEVLLYLGLKYPGPFFGVDLGSIVRSFQGEQLIPFGMDDCHHVFKIRPASVVRATCYALDVLGKMVRAVDSELEHFVYDGHPDAEMYRDNGQWCTGAYAERAYALKRNQLTKAHQKGLFGVKIEPPKTLRCDKGRHLQVFLRTDLQRLLDAADRGSFE